MVDRSKCQNELIEVTCGHKRIAVICSICRCAEKQAVDRNSVTIIQIGRTNDTETQERRMQLEKNTANLSEAMKNRTV